MKINPAHWNAKKYCSLYSDPGNVYTCISISKNSCDTVTQTFSATLIVSVEVPFFNSHLLWLWPVLMFITFCMFRWAHSVAQWPDTQEQCEGPLPELSAHCGRVHQAGMSLQHWGPITSHPCYHWWVFFYFLTSRIMLLTENDDGLYRSLTKHYVLYITCWVEPHPFVSCWHFHTLSIYK